MRATLNRVQTAPLGKIRTSPQYQKSTCSDYSITVIQLRKTIKPVLSLTVAILATAYNLPCLAQTVSPQDTAQTPIPVPSPSSTPTNGAVPSTDIVPALPGMPVPVPELAPNSAPRRTLIPAPTPATPTEDTYILGPGDQIGLDIFDVPEFSGPNGNFVVLVDGSISLPWIGRVLVQGLTLEQAADVLTRAYAPFIRDPLITVNLRGARTLRVSVVGEVKRPGSYIISPQGQTNQILVGDAGLANGGAATQWPTITQAIQSAGGITQLANLRQIQIRRPLPDGSEQLVDLNLWELLRTGRINQDITLRDRDTLIIPKAETINSDEALLLGSASFAPETIQVNVVGEVGAPGTIEVSPNTSLNQALLSAGGFDRRRARRSRVDLVRLNTDGTAVRRTVAVDLAAGINEETNPSLREGDTIIVGRSGLTGFRDFLDDVFGPINNVINGVTDIFN
ncbi:MAG: polysaccharide transporter [Leptolyngbyaceae cyanobacterium CRU_2_3]|nr:polysaccharide transporter [Leptolyngbyaceae cyanobacterium CRU_2_3]